MVSSTEAAPDPALETVIAAARALLHAGRWELGIDLLVATGSDHPRVRLALAELAVFRAFWRGPDDPELERVGPAAALARAAEAAERAADPACGWEVELLRLCHDYFSGLFGPDGRPRIGAGAHDPETVASLTARAESVHRTAPSADAAGRAAFWRGVIADNVAGDPAAAEPYYAEALAAGEAHRDDGLAAEALRHLGGLARRAGDHAEARRRWERSTWLNQRGGLVPWALSQQLALATNAADTGDGDRAATIAAEVHRWADALGLTRLADQARRLVPAD